MVGDASSRRCTRSCRGATSFERLPEPLPTLRSASGKILVRRTAEELFDECGAPPRFCRLEDHTIALATNQHLLPVEAAALRQAHRLASSVLKETRSQWHVDTPPSRCLYRIIATTGGAGYRKPRSYHQRRSASAI